MGKTPETDLEIVSIIAIEVNRQQEPLKGNIERSR